MHENRINDYPESVTMRSFSSENSRSTWPDVAKIDSAADLTSGGEAAIDAEAEALQRENGPHRH
jgi:hypothetical protein